MKQTCLSDKYSKVIALCCVIFSTMAVYIVYVRNPWSILGMVGGVIELVGSLSLPLIGMIIGKSFYNSDKSFKEFYKEVFIKFIIPLGIYWILLSVLSFGKYDLSEMVRTILSILIVAPFLKKLLNLLSKKALKYLIVLIVVSSFIYVYMPLFHINIPIDLSIFYNWAAFSVLGYAIPQIRSEKYMKSIYKYGIICAIATFILRTIPIDIRIWGVSPTMILYSSAVFLWINNWDWSRVDKFSSLLNIVNFIDKHKIGIFFTQNFIIINILNDILGINANRFKVIFGTVLVFTITLVLSGIITIVVEKTILKNTNLIVKYFAIGIEKIKNVQAYKQYLIWALVALFVAFLIEVIARGNTVYAIEFIKLSENKRFIANYLLVLAITSPCLIFKRLYLVLGILCEILLVLSFASSIMIGFRGTPLTYSDFFAIQDGIAIANQYITKDMLIIFGVVIVILIFINYKLSFLKVRTQYKFRKNGMIVIIAAILISQGYMHAALKNGTLAPVTWDIRVSYDDNGFVFSLYDSYKSYKSKKPKAYTEENMKLIQSNLNGEVSDTIESNELPNIIILQLESVMDPFDIEGIKLSDDPLKNLRKISEEYSSGMLSVPTFGGGTARSEFEVLTGMSLDYFSPGELPHNSYLKKEAIESLAFVLDSDNYEKTLIHNYQGSFYGRNKAYENLGFERYIPLEYMYDRKLKGEYPEDELILNNIIDTVETTEKNDLIFAIGVQTHGGYNVEYKNEESEIKVTGELPQEYLNQIQDFVDDLAMVDKMVGELVEYIENLDEPTILAVYSDHLPALNAVIDQFDAESKYLTPYFIYDNMGKEKTDMDLEAYQLSTRILDLANMTGGVMNRFHRNYKENDDYEEKLECVQYDILHGKRYIYDKNKPYKRTTMSMGIKEIIIDDIMIEEDKIKIIGQGFNEYSCVVLDGKQTKTKYVSENTLIAEADGEFNKVEVHQLSRYNKALGTSNTYVRK